MARGDTQAVPGPRRKPVDKARIAAKVAGFQIRTVEPWVQPLNPGFFLVEQSRIGKRAKQKKLRG